MTDYNGLKATELKELLKERSIPAAGLTRKQQYIDALEAQDAQGPPDGAEDDKQPTPDGTAVEQGTDDLAPADATANGDAKETQDTPGQPTDQSDNLKRKRRSPTPPVDEESMQKKLKAADESELAKLAEDLENDAPVPIENNTEETIKPMPVSDDVMDVAGQETVKDAEIGDAAEAEQTAPEPMAIDSTSEPNTVDPPSKHSPTSALYIRNLLRPLQLPPFRDHLIDLATPADQNPDDSLIETLHLDTFKSHAFVLFTSTAAAIRARTGLHDRIWPPEETQRKALWVDFIPPAQAQTWIATEQDAGKSRRFEVIYTTSAETGEVTASLEEASQHTNPSAAPGPGMPNAPTGPRGDRSQQQQHPSTTASAQPQGQNNPRKPPPSSLPASLSLFPSTTSKPKLFYRPVSPTLVTKRLEELDRETSRDWDGGRQKPFGSALDQLRRYTFEDGDVVVDGGVDFGGFGRDRGAGGGGHGGGGGGGGRRRGGGGRRR